MTKTLLTAQEIVSLNNLPKYVPGLAQDQTKSPVGPLALGTILTHGQTRVGKWDVQTTPGAEAAVAANAIEVACQLLDADGNKPTAARTVMVKSMAATANEGDLAAAGTPVGTVLEALNPATGMNLQLMDTDATGGFTFRVTDTVAEKVYVEITGEDVVPKCLTLTFA
jgi:hypothetical protein